MTQAAYQNEGAIQSVVEKFESWAYAVDEFTHARHLTVACWYLSTMPPAEALVRMRTGLKRFIAYHGKKGYHETMTRFWMELLRDFLSHLPPATSLTNRTNYALECFQNKDVLYSYYTRERVMSEIAKREWVAPDLRAIAEEESRDRL